MSEFCRQIANSRWFSNFILAMIVATGVLVGLETYPEFYPSTEAGKIVAFLQELILYVFVVEAFIKMAAHGSRPWRYFQEGWNIFDFTVVAVCFLPFNVQYAAVFRLARILRALRLVTALPKLQLLVGALLKSIPSLIYVGMLLSLHFYTYAVMGTFLFGKNDPVHFRSLPVSMVSLFEVVTLEGWVNTMYIQMYGSDHYGYEGEFRNLISESELARREPEAQPVVAVVYFVSFILLGTMIVLNLFTGTIIAGMEEAQAEHAKELREQNIKELGQASVSDELTMLAQQLVSITRQVEALKLRTDKDVS